MPLFPDLYLHIKNPRIPSTNKPPIVAPTAIPATAPLESFLVDCGSGSDTTVDDSCELDVVEAVEVADVGALVLDALVVDVAALVVVDVEDVALVEVVLVDDVVCGPPVMLK